MGLLEKTPIIWEKLPRGDWTNFKNFGKLLKGPFKRLIGGATPRGKI